MFETRNNLPNLLGMVSMTLIFLDPDGVIGVEDMADHNNLYMGFTYEQSASVDFPFVGTFGAYYDDEED